MKANEAPDKIYVTLNEIDESGRTFVLDHRIDYPICTEYTRTDAFIEKAREFLSKESNIPLWDDRGGNFGCDTPKLVENFIKYMEGE